MRGRIDASSLHRMSYNALLYADKGCILHGSTLWILGGHELRVVSSDEFFILSDTADVVEVDGPSYWIIELADLKLLEKVLRDMNEVFDLDEVPGAPAVPGDDIYDMLAYADEAVFAAEKYEDNPGARIKVHPDRLRKLSLVKPGGLPIELVLLLGSVSGELQDSGVVSFRIGETVRGLIAPLD